MSDSVKVFIRFRNNTTPLNHPSHGVNCVTQHSDGQVRVKSGNMPRHKDYNYDQVMFENGQEETYKVVGQPLLENIFNGYNSTLFVYGQTGSGKTYTMFGPDGGKMDDRSKEGIVPRQLRDIFREIKSRSNPSRKYDVSISIVDIYLEKVRDLLNAHVREENHESKNVCVRWHKKHGVFMTYRDGSPLIENLVTDYRECMKNINQAMAIRATGGHLINAHSSRSHLVIQLKLKETTPDGIVTSKLLLCDLAGSEKVKHTNALGKRLKEAQKINYGLSVLGNVLNCMTDSKKIGKLPPFRDSKLTMILQDALGGNSKTSLICGARPDEIYCDETRSTLQFGKRAKMIKCKVVKNEIMTPAQWKRANNKIKSQLNDAMNELKLTEARAEAFEHWADKLEEIAGKYGEDVTELATENGLQTCEEIRQMKGLSRTRSDGSLTDEEEKDYEPGARRMPGLRKSNSSKFQRMMNAQLVCKVEHLEGDINDLRQKLKAQDLHIEQLDAEAIECEREAHKLEQNQKEITTLRGQLYELKLKMKNEKDRSKHLEDALAQTSWEVNPMEALVNSINASRTDHRSIMKAVREGDTDKVTDMVVDQSHELEKLRSELDNSQKLNGSILKLRSQERITRRTNESNIQLLFQKYRENQTNHKNKMRTKNEEIDRLKKLVESLREQRDNLQIREDAQGRTMKTVMADRKGFHNAVRSSDLSSMLRKDFAVRRKKTIRRKKNKLRTTSVPNLKIMSPDDILKMPPIKTKSGEEGENMLSPVA